MTLAAEGASPPQLEELAAEFRAALDGKADALSPPLAALAPLLELRQHKSRIGCALLPWVALGRALG
jgi:NifU-like protein involved in Fe-S cluster formation